jgi:hypothetical protein
MNNQAIKIVVVLFLAFVPLIAYLDYYLLKDKATCPKCGLKPPKHAWLLATALEAFMFVCGVLLGIMYMS